MQLNAIDVESEPSKLSTERTVDATAMVDTDLGQRLLGFSIADLRSNRFSESGPFMDCVVPFPITCEGWLLAAAVVVAAKLGTHKAGEARLDVRMLSREREKLRSLNEDLRAKRDVWNAQEKSRRDELERQRVLDAGKQAREQARAAAEERRSYLEASRKEAERVAAQREAARLAYQAQQKAMDAEYQERVKRERQMLEEARRIKMEAEEAQRKAEAEEFRKEEEKRLALEAEELRGKREAIKRRQEEMKKLEKEKRRFAVRTEGMLSAQRPPTRTILPGPLEKEATIRISTQIGSLLGGTTPRSHHDFSNYDDVFRALPDIVSEEARKSSDLLLSALRLQAMAGEGAMAHLQTFEQEYWMYLTSAKTSIAALKAGEASLVKFRSASSSAPETEKFHIRTEIAVLPEDHPKRITRVFDQATRLIQNDEEWNKVHDVLSDVIEVENKAFYKDLSSLPRSLQLCPKCLGAVINLAYFLNFVLQERPGKTSDAPSWFEDSVAFVRKELANLFVDAPPDSLEAPSAIISNSIGKNHPVALEFALLADGNISMSERRRREERDKAVQAAIASKLLEEEWPDAGEIRAARVADKEAKTPLAEKLWAMRNVAGTLAMGGAKEKSRARKLLEEAVLLKQEAAGAADHPSLLPEFIELCDLLIREPDWESDAAGVASLILRSFGQIASLYAHTGDPLSGMLLLEAGLRKYEEIAGVKSKAVRAATNLADKLSQGLDDGSRAVLKHARSSDPNKIITRVSSALTDILGAYKHSVDLKKSKIEEWNEKGVALFGPLFESS